MVMVVIISVGNKNKTKFIEKVLLIWLGILIICIFPD